MTPARLRARRSVGGRPKSLTWPPVGWRRPSIRLMEVVLPAPFGPSMATISPGCMARLTAPALFAYLKDKFADDSTISVIMDRRSGQRRQRSDAPTMERRQGDRRQAG